MICAVRSIGEKWSGWPDSDRRPPDPQSGALTRLRYIPMCCLSPTVRLKPDTTYVHCSYYAERLRRLDVGRVDPRRDAAVLPRACPELPRWPWRRAVFV